MAHTWILAILKFNNKYYKLSMHRRQRQISFAQPLNNYVESPSREDSPSIAIESSQQIEQQYNPINISPLRNAHFRYLVNQGKKIVGNSHKENEFMQNKENGRPLKQKHIVNYCKNSERTPLKDKDMNASGRIDGQYSNTSSIKQEKTSSPLVKSKPPAKASHLTSHRNPQQATPSSFHPTHHKNESLHLVQQTSSKDRPGQNVDEQIYRLQMQIEQLRQLKKSASTLLKQRESIVQSSAIHSFIDSQFTEHNKNKCESTIKSFTLEGSMIKSQIVTFKERINEEDIKMHKILKKQTKRPKDDKVISPSINSSEFTQTIKVNAQKGEGNPQKRQKSIFQQGGSNELHRLLFNIQTQIKLDEKLRKAKKWFQRWRNESKWIELEISLKKSRYQISISTMRQKFSISSQEQNPFYTPKEDDFTLHTFIQHYEQAQHYWRKNMVASYSVIGLESGSFIEEKMDISKRGSINMEDLVRYINYQLDSAYRNRDIYLIYHRFKKGDVLYFKDVIEVLTTTIE